MGKFKRIDTDIEGVVIECGTFMTKLKFSYYSFWKSMRTVYEMTMNGKNVELRKLYNATANYFYKFIKDKYDDKCVEYMKILDSINNDFVKLSDLKQCELAEDGESIIMQKQIKTRTETGYTCENIKENINIGKENISKIVELRKKDNIISLRNEYYANGGV